MNSTLRALNGFGLGARVGERRRLGDPRGVASVTAAGGCTAHCRASRSSTNAVSEAIRAFRMLAQARDRLAMLYRTDKVVYGRFEAAMQQQDLVGEEPMAGSQ